MREGPNSPFLPKQSRSNVIKSSRTETIEERIDRIQEPLDLLRLKWCSEPSVHGGKKTTPSIG